MRCSLLLLLIHVIGRLSLRVSLLEFLQYRVDVVKCLVDVLLVFRTSEHDLAAGENKQNYLGGLHSVDQSREELRLVSAELLMGV